MEEKRAKGAGAFHRKWTLGEWLELAVVLVGVVSFLVTIDRQVDQLETRLDRHETRILDRINRLEDRAITVPMNP